MLKSSTVFAFVYPVGGRMAILVVNKIFSHAGYITSKHLGEITYTLNEKWLLYTKNSFLSSGRPAYGTPPISSPDLLINLLYLLGTSFVLNQQPCWPATFA